MQMLRHITGLKGGDGNRQHQFQTSAVYGNIFAPRVGYSSIVFCSSPVLFAAGEPGCSGCGRASREGLV